MTAVRPSHPLGVLLVALLIFATPAAALVQAVDQPSPAEGHAAVIAHGVAPMPDGFYGWRVIADVAESPERAAPEEEALGFALATEGSIVVNDYGFGTQARLAPGEAAFVPGGARQVRASYGATPVRYCRLALVPVADLGDAGGDTLVLAGGAAEGPGGSRDLDLVRDVLLPGEQTELRGYLVPAVVLVTEGRVEVRVEVHAGEFLPPVTLAAGEAADFAGGRLVLTGTDGGRAAFVAGLIGPLVPPMPRPDGSAGVQMRA